MSSIENFESKLIGEVRFLIEEIFKHKSGRVHQVSSEIRNHDYMHHCLLCHELEQEDIVYPPYGRFD